MLSITASGNGLTPDELAAHNANPDRFVRGLHLLSGPAQVVRWWRPHPAYPTGDINVTLRPGDLWLHHASLRFDA